MLVQLRRNLWNWLPTFLEIALAGSVVAAAGRLGLTPAAVSRTLGLLEDALGAQVFNRVGKQLVLNAAGIALRDAVREATRAVDVGLSETTGDPFLRPLRIASLGVLTELVVPCLLELKRDHATLVPEHLNLGAGEATQLLVRGRVDAAFYYEEVTAERLLIERLGQLGASVYCGRGHPLFAARAAALADVLAHPFSVPRIGDAGKTRDGWPSDVPRRVGMRIDLLRSNLTVALSGLLLTVLPDVTAAPHVRAGELRRLPAPAVPAIDVFVARHRDSLGRRPVELMIAAVRRRVEEAAADVAAALTGAGERSGGGRGRGRSTTPRSPRPARGSARAGARPARPARDRRRPR
jgi:DNA-binding transcriptional LysR family regulator